MAKKTLNETIGKKTLFFLIINAVLGTGIFFLPAIGAAYAGPASLLSWIAMSIVAIFISFYFAELISMFPKSGGVYEYTKNAFGEFPSFIFGWTAWIIANITIAMLIVGSLKYIFPGQDAIFNIGFSIFFIIFFNFISYRGIETSSRMLLAFGVMTLATLIVLIIPGIFQSDVSRLEPFFVFPTASMILSIYFIAETFFGIETIGNLVEEVKNPRKVIPKMLVLTTILIAIVGLLTVFISLTVSDWRVFAEQEAPLTFIADSLFGQNFARIFSLVVFIPLIGTAASWIVSSPRLLYAMSRDNVLVPSFNKIHKKYKTPYNAIIFQAIVSSAVTIIALGDFLLVLYLLVPLAVFMYSGVMIAFARMKIKNPRMKTYFRAPFPVAGPIAVSGFMLFLLYTWLVSVSNAPGILFFGLLFIFLGAPMYFLIKIQTDEKFTEKFFDRFSIYSDKMLPIWYNKDDVAKIVKRLGINKNSVVLDFGCGSGITTTQIAKRAKIVIGVDISEKQLEKAVKKVRKLEIPNVILYKERNMRFSKNSFDAVSAVEVLEYLNDPEKKVKKIFSSMKKGARFSFLSFGKSMGTPAPYHLQDEKAIRKLFSGLKTELHIKKESKKLTEYWHIWGKKK